MESAKITCKSCGQAKEWDAFTIKDGLLAGTILFACYDCYLKTVTEPPLQDMSERERKNAYARSYYRAHSKRPQRRLKTPEELLATKRKAAQRRAAKLKELALIERVRKAIELLEKHGFKVT